MKDLKQELNLLDVFCVATGAMISSGLFILPGLAFAMAGPAVILSYIFAAILCIPTLLSKAELTTAMPKAGGDYFYIMRGFGPLVGTIAGFSSWFSLSFKGAFALLGVDIIRDQFAAHLCGTALVSNMRFVFVTKIFKGRKNWVGGCFAQAAERALLGILSQIE